MNITITDSLQSYMTENQFHHIVVEIVNMHCCHGIYGAVTARFCDDKEAQGLTESNYLVVPIAQGNAYFPKNVKYPRDSITFDLGNVLWKKKIEVRGMNVVDV